jgi:hypothetical protein
MLDAGEWKKERFIRQTLRRLAKQRIALIAQPGDCWVIENAVIDTDALGL